jgi:hypothetical protein
VKTVTNKRYSYSRVTVIRIDVHPTGENLINTPHTFHARSTYDPQPYVSHVVCISQPFVSHPRCWADTTAPEKKFSWLHLSARLSGPWDPPQFLFQHSHWSSRLKPNIYWWQAIRLIGPISLASDRYVQYLLVGANPSVLNWHNQGLQPWRCWLTTSHSPTFPTNGPLLST